jgi:putative endonuclease
MPYFVYILQSEKDASYYVGQSSNLEERLRRHNEGRSRYTGTKSPWRLIYHETYSSKSEAMKHEYEIKRKKTRVYIDSLVRASRV